MSQKPTDAQRAQRIHQNLRRTRIAAKLLGIAALIVGIVMAAWTGQIPWLLISVVGVLWAVLFMKATGPAVIAAQDVAAKPTPPSPPGRNGS